METSPIFFFLNIAGAAALLIWAVRLVRTGFERAFGAKLRLWLRRSTQSRLAAASAGAGAAILMQSSTAVAVLMAGFVSAGTISGVAGLSIVLGGDLGSALVALLLNSSLAAVQPVLMLLGVLIFLRSKSRELRQIGRILIGLALIFMSLDLIRAASNPLIDSEGARTAMLYLADDTLTAFIIAALFAWLVHASVAAVLLFATLASQGLLPPSAAFAMVLGANLGGSMIAFFLTLNSDVTVRRVVWLNVILRGGGALIVLWALATFALPTDLLGGGAGTQALHLHVLFNVAVLLVCLPFVGPLTRLAERLMPGHSAPRSAETAVSALDPALQNQPRRAYACAVRELVQMGHVIEVMLRQVMPLFDRYDEATAQAIAEEYKRVERMSLDLRIYLAGIRGRGDDGTLPSRSFELSTIATNMEAGADMIARKSVDLARRKSLENLRFSDEGGRELTDFHDIVLRNVQHGITVLMSEDTGLARELVEQKEKVRDIARDLQSRHLSRLQRGMADSIETSAIHLELIRALKSLNTAFAMIAYPLLHERGELLESRLAAPET
ncbi:Na/Pi cotransporter family protein [Palleronia caenipelagi]|uniref:Na/Pi cotransporter family protein n=1 Tax=Palleronia caenipelagi TaxID=2489174 RepID=A0A547Q8W5_9RHOB|nr:Na/Pi cotransporter family protein [Palleronia caenipelagi]TRD22837.1 Na/Pi cotransporter family protein [Palleronia caenipelagi]